MPPPIVRPKSAGNVPLEIDYLHAIWEQLKINGGGGSTVNPVLVAPSFSLSKNVADIIVVGSTVNIALQLNYDRGSITLSNAFQNYRGGAANAYTFKQANNTNYPNQPQQSNQFAINAYNVLVGLNTFMGLVSFDAGSQPLDSNGGNFDNPLGAGDSAIQTTTIEGVYPILATTGDIETATSQHPVSMLYENNIQLTLVAESGSNKQFFMMPKVWQDARPVATILYFNTITNQFDTVNKLANFTTSTVNVAGVDYTKFMYNGARRGAITIKLIF